MTLITEVEKCKLCGGAVRVVRRANGAADHYETIPITDVPTAPAPAHLLDFLKASRKDKRTVAIVGSAWTTRGWAPYGEEGVEVWCFNEMHGQTGIGKATRWFQMHPRFSWDKDHRFHHREWLQQEHDFPIYMQHEYEDVPNAVRYPLRDVQNKLLSRVWKGEKALEKIFSSSFAYGIALALYEGNYDRIELFGIEMLLDGEYAYQRESMSFWVGKADGMDIEVWIPEQCHLFELPLYAYDEIRRGDGSVEVVDHADLPVV